MGVGVVVGLFGVQYVVNTIRTSLQQKQDLVDAARAESDDMTRIPTSGTIAADAMANFGRTAQQLEKDINGIVGVTDGSKFGIQDYA